MKHYTEKAESFIRENVLPKLGYSSIDEENIQEIVDYLVDNYEVPLSQAEEAGEKIDSSLLELVAGIVTEITTREDWNN